MYLLVKKLETEINMLQNSNFPCLVSNKKTIWKESKLILFGDSSLVVGAITCDVFEASSRKRNILCIVKFKKRLKKLALEKKDIVMR